MKTRTRGLCVWLAVWAWAAPIAAEADERARISAQRQELTMQFDARERACRGRFAATSCVEEVRALKRQALAPLRERELQLDAAERKQRLDQRQAAVAAKRQAASTPPARSAVPRAAVPRKAASASAATPRAASSAAQGGTQRRDAAAQAHAAQAAANAQSARREQAEIGKRQARIARRQAQRAATLKKATPLAPRASAGAGR
jgi:hypothetical protein